MSSKGHAASRRCGLFRILSHHILVGAEEYDEKLYPV